MYIYCFYDNPRRLVLEIVPRKKRKTMVEPHNNEKKFGICCPEQ